MGELKEHLRRRDSAELPAIVSLGLLVGTAAALALISLG